MYIYTYTWGILIQPWLLFQCRVHILLGVLPPACIDERADRLLTTIEQDHVVHIISSLLYLIKLSFFLNILFIKCCKAEYQSSNFTNPIDFITQNFGSWLSCRLGYNIWFRDCMLPTSLPCWSFYFQILLVTCTAVKNNIGLQQILDTSLSMARVTNSDMPPNWFMTFAIYVVLITKMQHLLISIYTYVLGNSAICPNMTRFSQSELWIHCSGII